MQEQRDNTLNSSIDAFEMDKSSSSSNSAMSQEVCWNNMSIDRADGNLDLPNLRLAPDLSSISSTSTARQDGLSPCGPISSERAINWCGQAKLEDGQGSMSNHLDEVSTVRSESRLNPTNHQELPDMSFNRIPVHNEFSDSLSSNSDVILEGESVNLAQTSNDISMTDAELCLPHHDQGNSEFECCPPNGHGDFNRCVSNISDRGDFGTDSSFRRGILTCKRKNPDVGSGQHLFGEDSRRFHQNESKCQNVTSPVLDTPDANLTISVPPVNLNPSIDNFPEEQSNLFNSGVNLNPSSVQNSSNIVGSGVNSWSRRMRPNPSSNHNFFLNNMQAHGHYLRNSDSHHQLATRFFPSILSSILTDSTEVILNYPPEPQIILTSLQNLPPNRRILSSYPLTNLLPVTLLERMNRRNSSRVAFEHRVHASTIQNTGSNLSFNVPFTSPWLPLHNPPYPLGINVYRPSLLLSPAPLGQNRVFPGYFIRLISSQDPTFPQRIIHRSPPGINHLAHRQQLNLGSVSQSSSLEYETFGVPTSMQNVPPSGQRRRRLVSQLRNILDLMQMRENSSQEDVLIIDQSAPLDSLALHDRHRDMQLDVDNMSYEELLALGERIGHVNTGLNEEIISKCLKQRKYSLSSTGCVRNHEPCCICQEEYVEGDDLAYLNCHHDFHTRCIKKWLVHKNLCPICKATAWFT